MSPTDLYIFNRLHASLLALGRGDDDPYLNAARTWLIALQMAVVQKMERLEPPAVLPPPPVTRRDAI